MLITAMSIAVLTITTILTIVFAKTWVMTTHFGFDLVLLLVWLQCQLFQLDTVVSVGWVHLLGGGLLVGCRFFIANCNDGHLM